MCAGFLTGYGISGNQESVFIRKSISKKDYMNERLYLFYQRITLKNFLKGGTLIEKVLFILWGITALMMGTLFIVITVQASDKLYIGILLLAVWLLIFPGLLLCAQSIEKSYWVEFKENYAIRHGDYRASRKIEKIFYEQAKYIVIGSPYPFVTPWRVSTKHYHKKYGNYINVTDKNNKILFSVRYSEETLDIVKQKCIYANVINR